VEPADLDGDGDADVLAAWQDDDTIAWYENLSNHGDDHGDAPESATLATALPAFLHGTLESGGDRDVFRVSGSSIAVSVSTPVSRLVKSMRLPSASVSWLLRVSISLLFTTVLPWTLDTASISA